jgi:small subunit ribosomal protein S9
MEILARAVGRRKEAVAQVQLIKGTGQFLINNKLAHEYLHNNSCSLISIKAPFEVLNTSQTNLLSFPLQNSIHLDGSSNETIKVGVVENLPASFVFSQSEKIADLANIVPALPGEASRGWDTTSSEATLGQGAVAKQPVQPGEEASKTAPTFQNQNQKEGKNPLSRINFDTIDTIVKVKGGGLVGQAEAIKLAVARAICEIEASNYVEKSLISGSIKEEHQKELLSEPGRNSNRAVVQVTELRKILKTKGYLTQDSRVKERRKYGLKKARKASQYHKR